MKRILFLTALAALFVLPAFAQEKQSPSFDEVLTTRRSIRSYDATKTISEQEVRTLMEAVQEAPERTMPSIDLDRALSGAAGAAEDNRNE